VALPSSLQTPRGLTGQLGAAHEPGRLQSSSQLHAPAQSSGPQALDPTQLTSHEPPTQWMFGHAPSPMHVMSQSPPPEHSMGPHAPPSEQKIVQS
jgi:hypothetical protein